VEPFLAVGGDVHDEAVLGEPLLQIGRRLPLVLDDQESHGGVRP
jgi:hypothetical protein